MVLVGARMESLAKSYLRTYQAAVAQMQTSAVRVHRPPIHELCYARFQGDFRTTLYLRYRIELLGARNIALAKKCIWEQPGYLTVFARPEFLTDEAGAEWLRADVGERLWENIGALERFEPKIRALCAEAGLDSSFVHRQLGLHPTVTSR